jgi:ribosome maturation factor RimP
MENNLTEELKGKIEKMIKEEGLDLVDFKLSSYGRGYSLRCLVDYAAGGIKIDQCAELNRKIFNFLEESKCLGEDFTLEVNSPGLDRPLKNYKDFLRVKGSIVGVWLNEPVDAKTYLEGEIIDSNEHSVVLKAKNKTYTLEPVNIKIGKARLDLQN